MNNPNGRKVVTARTHSPIHVVGVGTLSTPIDANAARNLGAVSMIKVEDGLLIEVKGHEVFVPNGNIISLQLAKE